MFAKNGIEVFLRNYQKNLTQKFSFIYINSNKASKKEEIWKRLFDQDFKDRKFQDDSYNTLGYELERLIKSDALNSKEKYAKIFQTETRELIYNKYKGSNRKKTPSKEGKELIFDPYLEYEKEKKMFKFDFEHFLKMSKLQIFNSKLFFFFLSDHGFGVDQKDSEIDSKIRKRIGFLFMFQFFIFAVFPVLLFFFYIRFGLIEILNPAKELSVPYFLLSFITMASTVMPLSVLERLNIYLNRTFSKRIFTVGNFFF